MVEELLVSRDPLDRKWIDVGIPCQAACPIMTDIPGYIEAIVKGDYAEAYRINRIDNILPGCLGRVCHRPCETACRHGRPENGGESVQICFLKRSAADFGLSELSLNIKPNGRKVCVIGAGPSGLTTANDLALRGYDVTVMEQFEQAGGMLRYGIPEFRLPREVVDADVKSIQALGVKIETGKRIEGEGAWQDLKSRFDAVILSAGCMSATRIEVDGMQAEGCYWGLDFVLKANRGEMKLRPKKVVVIGGGFTAVDCVRTAYRLGATDITLAYRRTKDQLRVGKSEIEAIAQEGIKSEFMVSPVAVESEHGRVTGLRLVRNRLDASGKAKPIEGSEFTIKVDTVILAVGQSAEELAGIPSSSKDWIKSLPEGFYAAGDFANGSGTVIEACAHGRKIARKVHEDLSGVKVEEVVEISGVILDDMPRWREHDFIKPEHMTELPLEDRNDLKREVEKGFARHQALIEGHRCYLCHYNFQIDIDRCIYCMKCIEEMPVDCIHLVKDVVKKPDGSLDYMPTKKWSEVQGIVIDNNACIRCGNCVRACPVDCISISKYHLRTLEIAPAACGSFEVPAAEAVS